MTQAHKQKLTFEEYLTYEDDTDNRYELIDGKLVTLPPESGPTISLLTIYYSLWLVAGSSH
ncbi:hypothetical protein [Microcoleus sp. MOSTC5]|uniref:hypothetical protein n=1 Tax=Microcoleus sp. MOSTC5 TaxID=3055378 RepID=UPI002FD54916